MRFVAKIRQLGFPLIVFYLFFFVNCFFPRGNHYLRAGLFSCLLALAIQKADKIKISFFLLIVVFVNIIGIIVGIYYNTPGALDDTTLQGQIIYPIVFLIVFSYAVSLKNNCICQMIIITSGIIALYNILFFFSVLPDYLIFDSKNLTIVYDSLYGGGFYHGRSDHVVLFSFSIPFTLSYLICPQENINKCYVFVSLCLQYWFSFIHTSDSLVFISLASIIIILLFNYTVMKHQGFRTENYKYYWLLAFGGLILILIFDNGYVSSAIYKMILKIDRELFSQSSVSSIRYIQGDLLIMHWLEAPILGNGVGAYMPECIRSTSMPWAYELSYHYMLFSRGIVGFAVHMCFYASIIYRLIKIACKSESHSTFCIALASGCIGYLFSGITNPTLWSFGYSWCLFIPYCYSYIKLNTALDR